MSYDNAKTWIKITIPIVLVLLGALLSYFIFRCPSDNPEQDAFVKKEQEAVVEDVNETLKEDEKKDSVFEMQIKYQDSVIYKNRTHAKEIIFMLDDIEGVYRTETMISLEESINDKKRLMHSIFNEL